MPQPLLGLAPLLTSIKDSFIVSPVIILAIAGFVAVLGIITTLLFEYHWKAYGVDKMEILRVRFWYYGGSIIFGGGMIISALLFVLNA